MEIQDMKKLGKIIGSLSVVSVLALGAFSGCTATVGDSDGSGANNGNGDCDADMDGYDRSNCDGSQGPFDCDDQNSNVNPGRSEICNGRDDNCTDGSDENNVCNGNPPPSDSDGDGDPDSSDCDDNNPNVCNGHVEVCGNGIDDNCVNGVDENCGTSTGNCGSCGAGGNDNPPAGAMCTVRFEWTTQELVPTGAGHVFGGFNPPSAGYQDHWSNSGQCVPNGNGAICSLSKNANTWSCSAEIESGTPLVFVLGFNYTPSDTDCLWSFDEGCWDGGGCSADNGLTRVFVENIEKSVFQVENPDQFPETDNGRVWVECD
jgi:hypothetical protein